MTSVFPPSSVPIVKDPSTFVLLFIFTTPSSAVDDKSSWPDVELWIKVFSSPISNFSWISTFPPSPSLSITLIAAPSATSNIIFLSDLVFFK